MPKNNEFISEVNNFFSGNYEITEGNVIPDITDIEFGKKGRELELAMLFIDIRESTKIVGGFRRQTAAKMYKSFLWGVINIARMNDGQVRSFNGDGVLIAFAGKAKCSNATKAAMHMSYFSTEILSPKLHSYFADNQELEDLKFNFGIGIDVGNVLVVRGGIRGDNNNDLVWVGNATNYAVKYSSLGGDGYYIYVSEEVYSRLNEKSKFAKVDDQKIDMWESDTWKEEQLYTTCYHWKIPE